MQRGSGLRVLRDGLAALLVALSVSLLAVAPAAADCQPSPAVTGDTVTCTATPPDNNGFQAGAGVNQLTVNVLTGVTVQNVGGNVIRIRDLSTLTNNGTLFGGDDGTGIRAGDGNVMTNAATGVIRVGDAVASGAFGVRMNDNNAFTNLGIIEVGSLVGCGCAHPSASVPAMTTSSRTSGRSPVGTMLPASWSTTGIP